MSVCIRVTFIDGDERHYPVGPGVDEFHTWYTRAETEGSKVAALVLKRYPAPSGSRLVIPLSQIRWYEVVISKEDERAGRLSPPDPNLASAEKPQSLGLVVPLHPGGAADAGVGRAFLEAAILNREATESVSSYPFDFPVGFFAEQQPGVADAPAEQGESVTATFYEDLGPCQEDHDLQDASIEGGDDTAMAIVRSMGPIERCARCGLVRVKRQPQSGEPERDLPGEVADRSERVEGLGRPEVRLEARAGDGGGAGPGGVHGLPGEGVAAVDLPEGSLTPSGRFVNWCGEHKPHDDHVWGENSLCRGGDDSV